MKLQTQAGERITITNTPFGAGGEGKVYKIKGPSQYAADYCIKLYVFKDETDRQDYEERIQYICDHPPETHPGGQCLCCWPEQTIFMNGIFAGFLMRRAPADSRGLFDIAVSDFQLEEPWTPLVRSNKNSFVLRLKFCVNLAQAVHYVQGSGIYVLTDFKPQNALVTPDGLISLIDLDSIQIKDGNVFLKSTAVTPDYCPPESYQAGNNDAKDHRWGDFSVACTLYQILVGIHPYMAISKPPYDEVTQLGQRIKHNLFPYIVNDDGQISLQSHIQNINPAHQLFLKIPNDIQKLFILSFSIDPTQRPTAEDWKHELYQWRQRMGPEQCKITLDTADVTYQPRPCIATKPRKKPRLFPNQKKRPKTPQKRRSGPTHTPQLHPQVSASSPAIPGQVAVHFQARINGRTGSGNLIISLLKTSMNVVLTPFAILGLTSPYTLFKIYEAIRALP